jgi:hypothetical protein
LYRVYIEFTKSEKRSFSMKTCELTPRCKVVLKTLIVTQLFKKFPAVMKPESPPSGPVLSQFDPVHTLTPTYS